MPPFLRRTVTQKSSAPKTRAAAKRSEPEPAPTFVRREPPTKVVAKPGDSFSSLSSQFGVPHQVIQELNQGVTSLSAGMDVKVPSTVEATVQGLTVPKFSGSLASLTGAQPGSTSLNMGGSIGELNNIQGMIANGQVYSSVNVPGFGTDDRQNVPFLPTPSQVSSSGGFIGPSPDVAQIQEARWKLDKSRFDKATVSIELTGQYPDNIPSWWAEEWGLGSSDLQNAGYENLGGNLWVRAGSGPTTTFSGGGSGGGGGRGSRGSGVSARGTTGVSGYGVSTADSALNWRIATG